MALTRISFAAAAAAADDDDDKDKDTEEVIVGDGGIRQKGRDRSRNEDKNNAAVIRDKGRGSSGVHVIAIGLCGLFLLVGAQFSSSRWLSASNVTSTSRKNANTGVNPANNDTNNSNTTNNTLLVLPLPLPLPLRALQEQKFVRFLHVGKAGGGTVGSRIKHDWNISLAVCHPNPCNPVRTNANNRRTINARNTTEASQTKTDINSGTKESNYFHLVNMYLTQNRYIVINIRDPIDRFVSAFYWKILVTCNPDGHDPRRQVQRGPRATQNPYEWCQLKIGKEEKEVLFHKYHRNVSALAEALCNNDNDNDNTSFTIHEDVKHDINTIIHAKHTLEDWFTNKFDWRDYTRNIIPVVLEKGFDLYQQIDDGILYLLNDIDMNVLTTTTTTNTSATTITTTTDGIEERSLKDYIPPNKNKHNSPTKTTHSSKLNNNNNNNNNSNYFWEQIPLSKLGEQCLGRYFRRDYELISNLITKNVCKNDACRNALQSILDRRSDIL